MNKLVFFIAVLSVAVGFAQVTSVPTVTTPEPNAPSTKTPESAPSNAPIKLDRKKITNKIKLQFDEDLVKGNAENTELNFIQTRKDNSFKKMIKIRENFIPEIESSASELGSK